MKSEMKNMLEDLEASIKSASKVPGIGNKAMVDIKKLKSIYDTLSQSMPEEILEASEVIKQKESIINQAYLEYRNLLKHNGINLSINLSSKKIDMFLKEINIDRLSNNPVNLDKDFLKYIYSQI